jgi:DNA-binding MarR family transcriptional regulator
MPEDIDRYSRVSPLARQMRPLVYRLYDLVRRHSPRLDLTLTQGAVLSVLVHEGPQRMSTLATREGVRLPSMTNVVSRLEHGGYVRRVPDPADGRAVIVSATEQARAVISRIQRAREEFLDERLARLSDADRDTIDRALPALDRLVAADEYGRSRPPDTSGSPSSRPALS